MRFLKKGYNFISSLNKRHQDIKYRKFISSFVDPKFDKDRIGKNLDELIEFDLVRETGFYELDGNLTKRFAMIDKKYFEDYIKSIKTGSSSFSSYIENADIKNDTYPSKFSVLLKKSSMRNIYVDVVCSRLMDFFEVDTVFNQVLNDEAYSKTPYQLMASIDFIKPNEEFYSLFEIDCNNSFNRFSKFEEIEKSVRQILKIFSRKHIVLNNKKENEKIIEDILYSFFVRRFILGDNDVRSGNFGILFNLKTHKVRFAPNFDFNAAFLQHNYCKDALIYLMNNYSNIYNKLILKFNELKKFTKYENKPVYRIYLEQIIDDELIFNDCLLKIENNIDSLNMAISQIEKEYNYNTRFID